MKGYKTSKDYKRLKELLDNGYKVIVICDDCIGFGVKEEDTGDYYFGGKIGITYFNPELFEMNCEDDDLEFIEPEEEL